jgi:hypothetical protein
MGRNIRKGEYEKEKIFHITIFNSVFFWLKQDHRSGFGRQLIDLIVVKRTKENYFLKRRALRLVIDHLRFDVTTNQLLLHIFQKSF